MSPTEDEEMIEMAKRAQKRGVQLAMSIVHEKTDPYEAVLTFCAAIWVIHFAAPAGLRRLIQVTLKGGLQRMESCPHYVPGTSPDPEADS